MSICEDSSPEFVEEIVNFEYLEDTESFTCKLRINICNEEMFKTWLKKFELITKTNWIARSSVSAEKSRFDFSKDYVCQHSSFGKVSSNKPDALQKNKKCPATLKVRIKPNTKDTRYKDPFVKVGLCGIININFKHSHLINVAEAWGWLRRKHETRESFLAYFNCGRAIHVYLGTCLIVVKISLICVNVFSGMSPAEAIHHHEDVLLAESIESLADASINPPKNWVYYLHNIWRKQEYGGAKRDDTFYAAADKRIEEMKLLGYIIDMSKNPFHIVIVSPLMQRMLQTYNSHPCIFIDSSSSCDQTSSSVTVISTTSKAGAVPIGIMLHSSQTEINYELAFSAIKKLWFEIHPDLTFEAIMTDDCQALRNALQSCWPSARLLLCQFHVLQSVWRWLWDSRHSIRKEDRKHLITLFKNVMYAENEDDLLHAQSMLIEDDITVSYPNFLHYFTMLWERKGCWSFYERKDIMNRGHNTNNFAEASFRILKDIILTRLKAYNPLALLDFVSYVLGKYYIVRLMDFAYGRVRKPLLIFQKITERSIRISKKHIKEVDNNTYEVPSQSQKKVYIVDSIVGICSCFSGSQGAFCIHQAAVSINYDINFINSPEITTADKVLLSYIAMGTEAPPAEFFKSMMGRSQEGEENLTLEILPSVSSERLRPSDMGNLPVSYASENLENNEVEKLELIESFEHSMKIIADIMRSNIENNALMKVLKTTTKKLRNIDTAEKTMQFLHQLSVGCRTKFGRVIRVQPTAISRRKSAGRGGSKRINAGRPLKNVSPALKKRKRCLSKNISLCAPNAKSHGSGH